MKEETTVNASTSLTFSCYVRLKDNEQILIDIEEYGLQMVNGNLSHIPTGVIKKVRLEELNYQSSFNMSGVALYALQVRGFKKDGGLRFRSEMAYRLDQKTIDQIPDEYHNYARGVFAERMIQLQKELTTMTNKGVQIGTI